MYKQCCLDIIKKDNDGILKNTIIDKLQGLFMLILEPMIFDNQ